MPLLCWLSDTGSWRWFTMTPICFWYFTFWLAIHEKTNHLCKLRKQGTAAWRAAFRVKSGPLPLTWLLTQSERPIACDVYWHPDLTCRAVIMGGGVYTFQTWSESLDRRLFGPLLRLGQGSGRAALHHCLEYIVIPWKKVFQLLARGLSPACFIIKQGARCCKFLIFLVWRAFRLVSYI